MPATSNGNLFGVGIYSVAEASRLTGVSPGRIRRWLRGYAFTSKGFDHQSPPVWLPSLPTIGGRLALSFLDLIEVRFVDAFRKHGVSWSTIRRAEQRARDEFGTTHPFSSRRFKTDGRSIFAVVQEDHGEHALLDIVRSQYAFVRILSPYLKGLDFSDGDQPLRWWPLGDRRRIVLDPDRSFGQPIVAGEGVPTAVLARAFETEKSVEAVAQWYDVAPRSVRDAVEFEEKIAA